MAGHRSWSRLRSSSDSCIAVIVFIVAAGLDQVLSSNVLFISDDSSSVSLVHRNSFDIRLVAVVSNVRSDRRCSILLLFTPAVSMYAA